MKLERYMMGELGATAVEYAIVASLICAVIAASVKILGSKVGALFTNVATMFPGN